MAAYHSFYSAKDYYVEWGTNVVQDTKSHTGQCFIQLLWGTDWVHSQNVFFRLGV